MSNIGTRSGRSSGQRVVTNWLTEGGGNDLAGNDNVTIQFPFDPTYIEISVKDGDMNIRWLSDAKKDPTAVNNFDVLFDGESDRISNPPDVAAVNIENRGAGALRWRVRAW